MHKIRFDKKGRPRLEHPPTDPADEKAYFKQMIDGFIKGKRQTAAEHAAEDRRKVRKNPATSSTTRMVNYPRRTPEQLLTDFQAPAIARADADINADDERERGRQLQTRIDDIRRMRGLDRHFQNVELFDASALPVPIQPAYQDVAHQLALMQKTPRAIVVLLGGRGRGKTHLTAGLVNEFVKNGRHAVYTRLYEMFVKIKQTYSPKATKTELQAINELVAPDLLAIDEAHMRRDTETENLLLTTIVDKRYANDKATLLVSNQTHEGFLASVGESIDSRIRERGGFIVCEWEMLRGLI